MHFDSFCPAREMTIGHFYELYHFRFQILVKPWDVGYTEDNTMLRGRLCLAMHETIDTKKEAKKNGYKNFKEFTNPFTFMDFCCNNKLNGENSMCEIKESGEGCFLAY